MLEYLIGSIFYLKSIGGPAISDVYDIVAVVGDTHCGGRTALMPRRFINRSEATYYANKLQRWLWGHWSVYWKKVEELRHPEGDLYVVINGDIFEGIHHNMVDLVSNDSNEHLKLGLETFQPMQKLKPNYSFVIAGTEAHAGRAHEMEEAFAQVIGAESSGTNCYTWPYLRLDVRNFPLEFAHHGRPGFRPWTRAPAADRLAAELVFEYAELIARDKREKMPKVAVRSHVHFRADSSDNYVIRVIYCPSWQGSTRFGSRIAPGQVLPIGGLIFKIFDRDRYETFKEFEYPRRDKPWQKNPR